MCEDSYTTKRGTKWSSNANSGWSKCGTRNRIHRQKQSRWHKKGKYCMMRGPIQRLFPLEVTGETCWEMSQLEIALQISIPPRQAAAVNVDIVRRITDWQWALWMGGGECKEINLSLDIPYWTMKDTYFQANIAFTTEKEYKHLLYRTGCLLLEELN